MWPSVYIYIYIYIFPTSGERLIRGHTNFDFTVGEGKRWLNASRDKNEGKHRRRKVEKSCVTFLLCDPDWCVHKSDVQTFFCVSGQRGTIAKSMHEEHLCIVALTSNGARNPVLSACLLPPRVIAYCSSSTFR